MMPSVMSGETADRNSLEKTPGDGDTGRAMSQLEGAEVAHLDAVARSRVVARNDP